MSPKLSEVPPDSIGVVWDQIGEQINRALKHASGDSTTPQQFFANCLRGDMMVWVVHREEEILAAIILRVQQRDAMRVLFVEAVAGREMALWVDMVESALREYRNLIGAQAIQSLSRDGMVRRLLKRGWKRKATLMELRE